jgi:hypothetical protein
VRADLLVKQNKPAEAEKVLNELVKSRPDDPDVWYDVAEVRGLSGNTIGLHRARAEYFTLVGDFRPGDPAAGLRQAPGGQQLPAGLADRPAPARDHGAAAHGQGHDGALSNPGRRPAIFRRYQTASGAPPG